MRFGFDCNDEKYGTLRAGPSLWGVTLPSILGVFGKDGSGSNLKVQNSWANEALAVVVQFEVLRLAVRNRETGFNWSEIATYSQEMAANSRALDGNLKQSRFYAYFALKPKGPRFCEFFNELAKRVHRRRVNLQTAHSATPRRIRNGRARHLRLRWATARRAVPALPKINPTA